MTPLGFCTFCLVQAFDLELDLRRLRRFVLMLPVMRILRVGKGRGPLSFFPNGNQSRRLSLEEILSLSRHHTWAPPVRATDLPILTWVSKTQARNCDRFFGQVVVPNSPDYLGNTSAEVDVTQARKDQ